MSRLPATIVIPVWNQWELTRACLESLRPTLGVRDEVVIVDNGSEDGTAEGLRQYSWARVITNEVNRGFAVACNQGAAVARRPITVFLNNDTLVAAHWLDGLLEPFEDATVGATGPRSNFVSGAQLVEEVDYAIGRMPELRRFAKEWRMAHRHQVTEVERLVGFCLAVPTDLFETIGGFDESFEIGGFEDDDLCRRIRAEDRRLVITHESFVHHHGHATFDANGLDWIAVQNANQQRYLDKHAGRRFGPLLSAALIVKNEERLLPSCLASLRGLVDEIVVYDTGSTDGTVAIAEEAGAKVIQGYWDDDFARARNAALEHCKSEWVLSIDADEVVEGSTSQFRQHLSLALDFDVLLVEIQNLGGTEESNSVTLAHRMSRVFRRDRAEWRHRLHEQIVPKRGLPDLRGATVDSIRLLHSGYLDETMAERGKLDRTIRIAETDLAGTDGEGADDPILVLNLARSLVLGGRSVEAMDHFAAIRDSDCSDVVRRTALRHGAETLLNLGRPQEAIEWAQELARHADDTGMARYLEGTARLLLGEHAAAAALLDGVGELKVEDGVSYSGAALLVRRGFAHCAISEWAPAAEAFTEAAADPMLLDPIWGPMIESYHQLGWDMAPIAELAPVSRLAEIAAQALFATGGAADAFTESLWARLDAEPRVLAMAIRIAPTLELDRAMEWSARLRIAGVGDRCPLIAVATDRTQTGARRVLAAALAFGAFGDDRAEDATRSAAAAVDDADVLTTLVQLDELAPALLPACIEGAVTDHRRAGVVADALADLGAGEQADAIRAYATERFGGDETGPGYPVMTNGADAVTAAR
jgi:GT2 family glycosyltransferase/tetratricopeptide (TPR) repeat protein